MNVTWAEADAFCKWEGKRLPTEAEWERASRGTAEGAQYPWGDRAPAAKDARFDVLDGPGAVCKFPKNYFGLCDMAGNVWEWVSDWDSPYGADPEQDPTGARTGTKRILRGGAFTGSASTWVRATRRYGDLPETRSHAYGFRCAKPIDR